MKKSVYSIVLMDDVVNAVDDMAYQMNTSRSNLINQILAERLSMRTPEMQMKNIFDNITRLVGDTFQLLDTPSDAMLSIRSPLRYKYKPTIRYSVELMREIEDKIGNLKITFRTQSSQLIQAINQFYQLWAGIENKYIGKYFPEGIKYEIAGERMVRELYAPQDNSKRNADAIGNAISEYIQTIDSVIKVYFSNLDDLPTAIKLMEKIYSQAINSNMVII